MYFKIINLLIIFLFSITLGVCKGENTGSDSSSETAVDPMTQKGIGPVTSVTLGEIDSKKAESGKKTFDMKCMACHEFDTKKVGPALKDVTKRRTPEWIMNMILNPNEMTFCKKTFDMKCMACHEFDTKKVGPALKDVTKRRTPEWIMNMILNPNEMTQKDPIALELLGTYLTQMANQNLKEEEAREILEYFRQKDK